MENKKTDPKNKDKKKRNELLLIAFLAAVIVLLFLANHLRYGGQSASMAEVSVDGNVVASYPLNQDLDTVIQNVRGGRNHLVIKDGSASIIEASCPDKVCVRQGAVKNSGQALVCLPNKVIVTIK